MPNARAVLLELEDQLIEQAVTGQDGTFSIGGLHSPCKTVRLQVEANGYETHDEFLESNKVHTKRRISLKKKRAQVPHMVES